MSNIFREIKRHIEQFIETEYWYRFRKIGYPWFDDFGNDATHKYKWNYVRAREHITCTWEGEKDILDMMRLKIEHMFWNLKHYGNVSPCYIRSKTILEIGTPQDKVIAAQRIVAKYDFGYKTKQNDWYSDFHKEWWTDMECEVHSPKPTRKYKYHSYINKIPFGIDNDIEYFLVHDNCFDGYGWSGGWSIESEDRKGENFYFPSCYRFSDIQKLLDDKGVKIDLVEGLIKLNHSVDLNPSEDLRKLSPLLREQVEGERQTLVDLLQLRHYIKKLSSLDYTDDKYFNMWKDIKDEDEKRKKMEESDELYISDRKELYHKITDLMIERGMGWWD